LEKSIGFSILLGMELPTSNVERHRQGDHRSYCAIAPLEGIGESAGCVSSAKHAGKDAGMKAVEATS
jgi:hypothetical protein